MVYPILKGRFKGACLSWTNNKKRCFFGNVELKKRNVKAFTVNKGLPFYYYRCPGYVCTIEWCDKTQSIIILPSAGVKMVEKAIVKK